MKIRKECDKDSYTYTKIRENIWQIHEDDGVCCTLVQGDQLAVLVDTGYGKRNLRTFVEEHIKTPYLVIDSHGHPDHIGGNQQFDTVYAAEADWDVIRYFEGSKERSYILKEIKAGEEISLGNLHMQVVSLAGHTRGSIGLLVQEEKLLIAGDALNEGLWLFNFGSLSMRQLYETIEQTVQLPFETYLCGHSVEEYPRQKLYAHLQNIRKLEQGKPDTLYQETTIGFETYRSVYEGPEGRSEIVFTEDKIPSTAWKTEGAVIIHA